MQSTSCVLLTLEAHVVALRLQSLALDEHDTEKSG